MSQPVIIIPKITFDVMKLDDISSDKLTELIEHCSKYNKVVDKVMVNTHDKPEDVSDCDITNDVSQKNTESAACYDGPLIEISDDNLTLINRKTGLATYTHPQNLMIMETTFDRSSNISDKALLKVIYDNAKFCVYTEHRTQLSKIAIVFPPNIANTLLKASSKQFRKCMATYYLFMFEVLEFNDQYRYPFTEIYSESNNIRLHTSIFLMYDETDYAKFSTTKTYEKYVEECFQCNPGQMFHKKNLYIKINGTRDGYYNTITSGMFKQFETDHTTAYTILNTLKKVANGEMKMIKGEDWYEMEFSTVVLSSSFVNMFYRKRI